jgi:mannose-6-phosphate isomerase
LADEVAELCLARFTTPDGLLLEYFDAAWAPAAGLQGRLVWPGHQFEWAGLLERWALLRKREDARTVARRLYRYGADHGIDPQRGVAVFELLDDLSVNDAKARLWSQTEWLKAALILARSAKGEERQAYVADAISAAKALLLYLDTPIAGLWRDKLLADGSWVDEPAPASSFYHIVDALRVLAVWPTDPMLRANQSEGAGEAQ